MTIQALKEQIESKKIYGDLIIFKNSDSSFISNQYIQEIAKITKKEITYIDSLEPLLHSSDSFFQLTTTEIDENLNVLKTNTFTWTDPEIMHLSNLIVVVNKFESKEIEKLFEPYVVSVPKLEAWQIKDYVYSIAEGVSQKDLDWLISLCGNNLDRLQQELDKLQLFSPNERKYLFDDMVREGCLNDLSSYGVFNFTSAITSKDYFNLIGIYKELDRIDINEFGLLTILLKNFKNLLMVQLNINPTPENTGLESKQLYAIKKLPRVYSPEQLVNIFQFLSGIDSRIKTGELSTDILVDYLIIKILSM